ncbi:MAG TPA: hypothetical protein PK819_12285, partial [Thermomicrobiales bacterium]|nr:hypothetical protein [Thermomicrobiales bacterium]
IHYFTSLNEVYPWQLVADGLDQSFISSPEGGADSFCHGEKVGVICLAELEATRKPNRGSVIAAMIVIPNR